VGKKLRNAFLEGNFGPVEKEVTAQDLEVVAGAIPQDFPRGMYCRNGPNPRFPPVNVEAPVLGRTAHHWFEGDAMVHAVRIDGGKCSYMNRYIRTPDFEREGAAGTSLYRGIVDTTSMASFANVLLNLSVFGNAIKDTPNTSVLYHGGRLLALVEGESMPTELRVDDLGMVGRYQFGREEPLPSFTAHPKVDPTTGELIFTGYSALSEPPVHHGVVGPDGKLKHWSPVRSAKRKTLMHDCAITEQYTLVLDFPLTIDPSRTLSGDQMVAFEEEPSRIGVVPRYADDAVRWFEFEPGYGFHVFNAFEDGDEVVLRACRCSSMALTPPWEGGFVDREAYMSEYFAPGSPKTFRLHEWRMNVRDGSCSECDLGPGDFIDFPIVSPKVVGRPFRFGYCARFERAPSVEAGVTVATALRKYAFGERPGEEPQFEEHVFGDGVYGQEGVFVPRPGGTEEDDGWVVVFTYDEATDHSEFRIVDAKRFSDEPVARVRLPQRVPYGFHGTFVPL